jgi:peptidoglycan lytic transglycosylase D
MPENNRFLALACFVALLVAGTPTIVSAAPGSGTSRHALEQTSPAFASQPKASPDGSGSKLAESEPALRGPSSLAFVESKPRLVPPFPILLNRAVRQYVDNFLGQPGTLLLAFQRSRPFIANMMSVLEARGLPADLVYLAFAESEFSKRGKGPWQFNQATARRLGLHINKWVDERRDPILSTRAAAEYLAELHDRADDDWRMTLVGWNLGEGYIDRYWLLEGSPENYAKFERYLPRPTRQLLVRFMAVAFIAHNAASYGITPVAYLAPPAYKTRRFPGGTLLWKIAARCHTTVIRLRALNPQLLRDRLPPYASSYRIRVPATRIARAGRRL